MRGEHRQQGFASPWRATQGPGPSPRTLRVLSLLSPQPCGTITILDSYSLGKLRLREGKQLLWNVHGVHVRNRIQALLLAMTTSSLPENGLGNYNPQIPGGNIGVKQQGKLLVEALLSQ